MCVQYRGGYFEYRWRISWCTWGILWVSWGLFSTVGGKIFTVITPVYPSGTVWSVIHLWDPPLKQLLSRQQIDWHYVELRIGPILKGVFGQLPIYLHCSRPLGHHMGPTCTSVFGQLPQRHHYSRPCGYRVELHMRPAWTSVWGSFHTIVTRSDPSGIMKLHMGPNQKVVVGQLLYYPYSCGPSGIV